MKAKVIKTGEIVDVYHEPVHGQVSNIYKESVFVNGRMWQENELEFIETKEVDLEKELNKLDSTLYDMDGVAIDDNTNSSETRYITVEDVKNIAKHFFELGLKARKGE